MKARHVFFSLDMSTELENEVTKLLFRTRVTLIENGFAKACFQSVENPAAARDDINKQIRGFGDARLKPSDIHPALWFQADRLVKGSPLE